MCVGVGGGELQLQHVQPLANAHVFESTYDLNLDVIPSSQQAMKGGEGKKKKKNRNAVVLAFDRPIASNGAQGLPDLAHRFLHACVPHGRHSGCTLSGHVHVFVDRDAIYY